MGNAWISLPLGKLKMTQIHNTGWRFPKSFWTQMRSSILDCLYRLHHHPHQRVHVILLPALTGDLLEKWKNGKGCWEKWDGEQCNRRGVEDTGVREEQALMSALSLCILPRWTEALWCHQASPLKWKQTNYKVSTADYGYSKRFWDEKGKGIQEPLFEDSPLTFNPLSQANWAKGDM